MCALGSKHTINDCPQQPVIVDQGKTLHRLDKNYERVAVALETLAQRGAQVDSLEIRTDSLESDVNVAFGQIRGIDDRVQAIELKAAEYKGRIEGKKEMEKEVEKEEKRFWTLLERLQLLTPILITFGFIIYLMEKFNIFTWFWHQFNCFAGGK